MAQQHGKDLAVNNNQEKAMRNEAKGLLIQALNQGSLTRTLPNERGAWTLWSGETNITSLVIYVATGYKSPTGMFETSVMDILGRIADWLPMGCEIGYVQAPTPAFKDRLMVASTRLRLGVSSRQISIGASAGA